MTLSARNALCAVALAVPAAASADEARDLADQRVVIQEYGNCIAKRERKLALDFVIYARPEDGQNLANESCIRFALGQARRSAKWMGMGFRPSAMRAAVAESLIRSKFDRAGPGDFSAVPLLHHPDVPAEPPAELTTGRTPEELASIMSAWRLTQQGIALDKLGECAARQAPETVRKLALTKVNSERELEFLRAMAPALGECLPEGLGAQFDPDNLRPLLVTAYARLAFAPATSASPQPGTN